jgi:hypothetical protein
LSQLDLSSFVGELIHTAVGNVKTMPLDEAVRDKIRTEAVEAHRKARAR